MRLQTAHETHSIRISLLHAYRQGETKDAKQNVNVHQAREHADLYVHERRRDTIFGPTEQVAIHRLCAKP
jgi:hypothetical protein